MDLHAQLTVVRRHLLLIVEAIVVVAAIAGLVAHSRTPVYQATSQVLLKPNDPNESIDPSSAPIDSTGYSAIQAQLVKSPPVTAAVAKDLHVSDPTTVSSEVSVSGTTILQISATDPNAKRAQLIANAYANEYLAYARKTMVDGIKRQAAQIEHQMAALRVQIRALPTGVTDAVQTAIQGQYQALFGQDQKLRINQQLAQGNAQLFAPATLPTSPNGTPLLETVLFGAVGGLMLGLGGAFLREQLDDRIRTREEAEHASGGLPVLAECPMDRRAVRVVTEAGLGEAMMTRLGETARALRTAVMFLGVRREVRRILVTSPGVAEGKSLMSALLAAAYAQAGFRTILITADLRRPALEELVAAPPNHPGLTDALLAAPSRDEHGSRTTENYLDRYITETTLPNLSFLASGPLPPNPGEMLGSQRMEDLLDDIAAAYDVLILDTAPLLPVADTRALVDKVDGVVMITSLGQSKRAVSRARETLAVADVHWLGVVVNRIHDADDGPYQRKPPGRRGRLRTEELAPIEDIPEETRVLTPANRSAARQDAKAAGVAYFSPTKEKGKRASGPLPH